MDIRSDTFLNNFQLVRFEAEGRLPDEMLMLFDGMIAEAAEKLKTLGGVFGSTFRNRF